MHHPPVWLIIPFICLLLMISTGPLFYHQFWARHYARIAIGLGAFVAVFYGFMMENGGQVLMHTLQEYLSFIALLSSLFVVSGGIFIKIQRQATPVVNGIILFSGAVLSNLIGTTGASMLLIRPFLRMNKGRIKAFHVVFFIFIVSNTGGALTPVGDPPLFLGFLKGVPFFWVISRVWIPWMVTNILLTGIFMFMDAKSGKNEPASTSGSGGVSIAGAQNFFYLFIIIGSIFLDPAIIDGFPSLQNLFGFPFGIREIVMVGVAVAAYLTSDKDALKGNEFNFEPIKEVAFLFIGIFATMIPALELIGNYAANHAAELSVTKFYWMTGFLSSILDNAPTYLNFLAGAAGKFGIDIASPEQIRNFSGGIVSPVSGDVASDVYLTAISLASVFFGAMTYIGNAPNFMVRNIAAQAEVEVPDFLEYVYKYSLPVLMPVFLVLWFLLFNF
ncbi:MAG: citrate transporter [Chlorobium sp.]|nr:MAG: citrate transporter [Chlorobium sp.]